MNRINSSSNPFSPAAFLLASSLPAASLTALAGESLASQAAGHESRFSKSEEAHQSSAAELSDASEGAAEHEQVRWDLIRRLRREIAAGTYASPERWQQSVARLSDELAS